MKAEVLMDAIGNLSDAVILECESLKMRAEKKRYSRIMWGAAAACLSLAVLAGGLLLTRPVVEEMPKLSSGNWQPRDHVIDFVPERKETEAPVQTAVSTEVPTPTPEEKPTVVATPEATEEVLMPVETEVPKETDWGSMWTYFIADLEREEGGGVTSSPGERWRPAAGGGYPAGVSEADQYFYINSEWTFEFDYSKGHYSLRKSPLSEDDVGAYIGVIELNINETALKGLHYQKKLYAYAVKNISAEAAIAIRIDSGKYYLFINTSYSPNNLEEFLSDFNLISTTRLTQMAVFSETDSEEASISDIMDEAEVWNILLSSDSSYVGKEKPDSEPCINIQMHNNFYRYYWIPFSLYDEGYIYFNVLGNELTFLADQEMISRILESYEMQINNNN